MKTVTTTVYEPSRVIIVLILTELLSVSDQLSSKLRDKRQYEGVSRDHSLFSHCTARRPGTPPYFVWFCNRPKAGK
jgi:hypothetical protein